MMTNVQHIQPPNRAIPGGCADRRRCVGTAAGAGLAVLLASSSAMLAGVSAPPAPPPAAAAMDFDHDLAHQTFDAAWTLVYETHFDPEFNGVDWEAVRDELRPRVAELNSNNELRSLIQEMVNRLGQSHFAVISDEDAYAISEDAAVADREAAEVGSGDVEVPVNAGEGELGFDVRLLDGQIVVTEVVPGSAADEAGIEPGWVLDRIGTRSMQELIDQVPDTLGDRMRALQIWQMAQVRLHGRAGREVTLTFLNGDDQLMERTLVRTPVRGTKVKFGNLPTMYAHLEHDRLETETPGVTVGLIRFNVWMIPIAGPFAEAIDELRDSAGIILDLRGNIGGVAGLVMGTSGHFLDEQITLGTLKLRDSELKFVSNPRRVTLAGRPVEPFDGPLAILVDNVSASTTEVFAAGMQGVGRARVFGERSMGAALPAAMGRLPNGDVLLHAFADFLDPHGKSVEGAGVLPDEPVELTREALLQGRDPVLEAAVAWIHESAKNGTAESASAVQAPADAAR